VKLDNIFYDELIDLARVTVGNINKRGYYYCLNLWNKVFNDWMAHHNIEIKDIPLCIIDQITDIHLMFREYFYLSNEEYIIL
jgi:hypothetical protein